MERPPAGHLGAAEQSMASGLLALMGPSMGNTGPPKTISQPSITDLMALNQVAPELVGSIIKSAGWAANYPLGGQVPSQVPAAPPTVALKTLPKGQPELSSTPATALPISVSPTAGGEAVRKNSMAQSDDESKNQSSSSTASESGSETDQASKKAVQLPSQPSGPAASQSMEAEANPVVPVVKLDLKLDKPAEANSAALASSKR